MRYPNGDPVTAEEYTRVLGKQQKKNEVEEMHKTFSLEKKTLKKLWKVA